MKIVLEMNHDEALCLLEKLSEAVVTDDTPEQIPTTLFKRLREAIKHPQPDKEPDIEAPGRLGD